MAIKQKTIVNGEEFGGNQANSKQPHRPRGIKGWLLVHSFGFDPHLFAAGREGTDTNRWTHSGVIPIPVIHIIVSPTVIDQKDVLASGSAFKLKIQTFNLSTSNWSPTYSNQTSRSPRSAISKTSATPPSWLVPRYTTAAMATNMDPNWIVSVHTTARSPPKVV